MTGRSADHSATEVLDAGAGPDPVNGRYVDADALHAGVAGQLMAPQTLGCEEQVTPLGGRDARERPLERTPSARPNLHDDDECPLLRHDIELEMPEAQVGREDSKPVRHEVVRDGFLRAPPPGLSGGRQNCCGQYPAWPALADLELTVASQRSVVSVDVAL